MVWALRFDGVNETAETGVHVISNPTTDNFYVEIDIEALSGDGTYVAQNTSNTESNRGFQLGSSSGLGGFFVVIGGSRTDLSITPSAGLWRFEFDGSTYSVLKDSSQQGSGVLSRGANSEPSSTLCFGARHAGSNSSYSFFKSMDLKSCEIGVISGSAIGNWDATLSDQTSNPPILDDLVGNNDATGVNMDVSNWIDLGGGDNSLTVTEDSALSIADSTVTETVSTINENSSLSLTDATLLSTTVSLIEKSEITINDTSVTSSKTIIIDNSDIEIIDTTIVVFKTSGNSLTTTEDTELSLTDSTIVAFRSIINESTELSSFDTTLNYFPTAVIEDGVFAASDETITAFSSRIIENAALELVDTTVVNFPSGDFNPIIGLTLELSSDIITLELSSEQEIRELA